MMDYNKMLFDLSVSGRAGYVLPTMEESSSAADYIDPKYLSDEELRLPEISEVDVVRHYTNLANKNFGVDTGMYPLGSCTMKYNPKINEDVAAKKEFTKLHPLQDERSVQGAMKIMQKLEHALAEISGMDAITLQPAAGAHGEITGILLIRAYHESRGEGDKRTKIIIPDSAHGTNPATSTMAGYEIVEIKSNDEGLVDVDALKRAVGDDTAGLMLTNPNTLGLFEKHILEIAKIVHDAGGLLYYDGANANAILGHARPGDMGFDICHFNVHKTFSTPHGGGGPGGGPVGVKAFLEDFLPGDRIVGDEVLHLEPAKHSIGRVKDFHGHFGIYLRALAFILTMGGEGLTDCARMSVLNANYLRKRLEEAYEVAYNVVNKHEVILAGLKDAPEGIHTLDVAKRLIDKGYHPPTVYFPLVVPEAIMIEPAESESKETLDEFADAMLEIAREARENPELLKEAPHHTPVRRPDETKAARDLVLTMVRE